MDMKKSVTCKQSIDWPSLKYSTSAGRKIILPFYSVVLTLLHAIYSALYNRRVNEVVHVYGWMDGFCVVWSHWQCVSSLTLLPPPFPLNLIISKRQIHIPNMLLPTPHPSQYWSRSCSCYRTGIGAGAGQWSRVMLSAVLCCDMLEQFPYSCLLSLTSCSRGSSSMKTCRRGYHHRTRADPYQSPRSPPLPAAAIWWKKDRNW